VENNLLSLSPSPILNRIYPTLLPSSVASTTPPSESPKPGPGSSNENEPQDEKILLSQEQGRQLVEALEVPELELEIERAIFQVENVLKKERDEKAARSKSNSVSPDSEKKGQ
jgi:hypothetical protein